MPKKKKNIVARTLGKGLAHFQSFVDDVFDAGFSKLKETGQKKSKKKIDTSTVHGKVKYGLKKTAGFVGEMGESFYSSYEDIKSSKKSNRKK